MSDENEVKDNENESPEQKADKETKKYLKVMETVQAIVGGKENLKPKKKVTGDVTASLVAELFKEENEELRAKVKLGLKDLLKKHVELEAEVAKKEKELKELQLTKRKDFTKAANNWLQQVDQAEVMKENYKAALQTAFTKEDDNKS